MNQSGASAYISVLLQGLRFDGAREDAFNCLRNSEWIDFLDFCDRAQIALPIGATCGDLLPLWARERLAANLADNCRRMSMLKARYEEIASAFLAAHAKFLLLKGFAQCPHFAPRLDLRMQSDFDFYCPDGNILRARDALQSIGYKAEHTLNNFPADHLPMMTRSNGWRWRGNYYDPEMPPSVDLHFCFWNAEVTRVHVGDLHSFWERREWRIWEDLTFPALSLTDHVCFCALHVLRDVLRGDWILHRVYELAHFLHLRAGDDKFWEHWEDAHEAHLRSLQLISFSLARSWFQCDLHPSIEALTHSLPHDVRTWLDRFSHSPLEGMLHANNDCLWLHLSLLNKPRDRAIVFLKHILPPRIPALGAPGQNTDRYHRMRRHWPTHRLLRYVLHLVYRSADHIRTLPRTIAGGLSWLFRGRELATAFWRFFAASFFFDLGFSIYFFLYGLFLIRAGYTEATLGFMATGMSIGGIAGSLPAGMLLNRFGLRRILLACFSLAPVLAALRAIFIAVPVQFGLAFLGGVALSVWAVTLSPTVAALVPEKSRPFAFSLVFSAGIGVGALGALLGGMLPSLFSTVHSHISLLQAERFSLLLSCAVVALGAIPISKLRTDVTTTSTGIWRKPHPFLLRYLPCIAIWSVVTGAFGPFAPVYFAKILQMPLHQIGAVFSASQVCQVGAILLAPVLLRRAGVLRGLTISQFLTSAALLAFSQARHVFFAPFLYISYVSFQWMSEPGLYTLLMSKVPEEERSHAAGLNFFAISCCQATAASLAGEAISRKGYSFLLIAISVVACSAALLFRYLLQDRESGLALHLIQNSSHEPAAQ